MTKKKDEKKKSDDQELGKQRELSFAGEMEKIEICTALFHLLPLGTLRELFKLAQTVSAKIK